MEASPRGDRGAEPERSAGEQISSTVDLLLTVGYIDGSFHYYEQAFVQRYIDSVLLQVEQSAPVGERETLKAAWQQHFHTLYKRLDTELAGLTTDIASAGLRARAMSLFRSLSVHHQKTAIELIHALIHADGILTPPEQTLYQELTAYFAGIPAAGTAGPTTQRMQAAEAAQASLIVGPPVDYELQALSHPLLDPLERTYSPHPVERKSQVDWDFQLLQQAVQQWQRQRAAGTAGLAGFNLPTQIPTGSRFLDGHVYVMRPKQPVELVVLGDLHGCYSCLKAALLQSNFVQRVWAHQWDPDQYPDVKLVLLGDYIDRGLFSFDGVLRAALYLFVSMPDHVILLRGNHEYLKWSGGRIISGVYPAEALSSIEPHVPLEMLDAYRFMFEQMPTSLLCDQTLFVHAGIPRDDTFEARYRDLSSLNDPELRFQMMWSDPVKSQHIPVELQKQNPRFSFGHNQFRSFMDRLGLRTMIRGHEQIDAGFQVFYDRDDLRLLTLFSSGGRDNCDLPRNSSYRSVTPMALSMRFGDGTPTATPWPLRYHAFNYPPHNGLYRPHPVLEFRHV